ncbi:MAG: hypothetical protein CL862_00405 [Cyanobium sp. NAT70]|nr:hypothetical protein [Cyanobium sp. NAT70]
MGGRDPRDALGRGLGAEAALCAARARQRREPTEGQRDVGREDEVHEVGVGARPVAGGATKRSAHRGPACRERAHDGVSVGEAARRSEALAVVGVAVERDDGVGQGQTVVVRDWPRVRRAERPVDRPVEDVAQAEVHGEGRRRRGAAQPRAELGARDAPARERARQGGGPRPAHRREVEVALEVPAVDVPEAVGVAEHAAAPEPHLAGSLLDQPRGCAKLRQAVDDDFDGGVGGRLVDEEERSIVARGAARHSAATAVVREVALSQALLVVGTAGLCLAQRFLAGPPHVCVCVFFL